VLQVPLPAPGWYITRYRTYPARHSDSRIHLLAPLFLSNFLCIRSHSSLCRLATAHRYPPPRPALHRPQGLHARSGPAIHDPEQCSSTQRCSAPVRSAAVLQYTARLTHARAPIPAPKASTRALARPSATLGRALPSRAELGRGCAHLGMAAPTCHLYMVFSV
jgi:hypothetical protein